MSQGAGYVQCKKSVITGLNVTLTTLSWLEWQRPILGESVTAKIQSNGRDASSSQRGVCRLCTTDWQQKSSQTGVRGPVGPVRIKGRPKIATQIRFGIETSNEKRRKRLCGTAGNKAIYPRGVEKVSWACNYYETSRTGYNCNWTSTFVNTILN